MYRWSPLAHGPLVVSFLLLCCPLYGSASGQELPITAGDLVRAASADSAEVGLWITGSVLSYSRDSLLLTNTVASPIVRLNESIRLQVNRGKKRRTAVGGVGGLFAGGVVGVLSMSMEQRTSRSNAASFGPMLQYCAVGAVVGAIIGSRFGPQIWEEVPVGQQAMLAAAVPVSGVELADVVNVEWWNRLEGHDVDVGAILELNAGNLSPIEGTWNRLEDSSVVAIVRESRYDGIDFVAYEPSGRIVGAVNATPDNSAFRFRFPPGTRQYSASLSPGVLTVRSPGDTIRQWIKQSETLDSSFIALARGVTVLSPVIVEAPRLEERLQDVGFLNRRQTLAGTFLTREDIARQNPETTADVLRRIPGFSVSRIGHVSAPRESMCSGVEYFVDGVHVGHSYLSAVLPSAIAGMEVYTSAAAVPIQYHLAGNPRCGVILIWTVDGRQRL